MSREQAPAVLVVHDAGDPGAGSGWVTALEDAGWPGAVHAPDLPGHGTAAAPEGGADELVDAAFAVLALLDDLGPEPPVVVGVGANGWAAQLLALGGRASALVLVDGLGGPWLSPRAAIAAVRDRLRAVADDPAAVGPAPRGRIDPRFRHAVPRQTSLDLAHRGAAALRVPVLVVESPGSLAGSHREALVSRMADATVRHVPDAGARTVAATLESWIHIKAPGLGPVPDRAPGPV